jgi:copper(I)-binding protein
VFPDCTRLNVRAATAARFTGSFSAKAFLTVLSLTVLSLTVLSLTVLCFAASACSQPALSISDPQIRELIPGRTMTVAYFVLANPSAEALTISGAESTRADAIEMHTTILTDGNTAMRRLTEVEVPAGERVVFAPGGHHLMVFGVTDIDGPFPITLSFTNGKRITAVFSKLAL